MKIKKIFIIGGGIDASNYKNYEEYLRNEEFNPYEEKVLGWKDNLQEDLGIGFEVIKIPMPNKGFAEYEYWKIMFEKALPYFEEENILIGHSLGGCFLLKYLEENKLKNISEIHLVAPASFDTPEEKLGSFSFDTSLEKFKKYENITNFYFSRDDEVVPFWEYEKLKKILPNAKYNIFEDFGHFRMEHFEKLVENIKKINKTKIIFVRHAESIKNIKGIHDGTNEKKYKLSEKGEKQAEELKNFLINENVGLIYSSYFERAIETIKPFSIESGIEIITDERLRETHHGIFEETIGYSEEFQKSKNDFKENPNYKFGETGDSHNEILKRCKDFIEDKIKKNIGKTIVIVSHGYPVSVMLNEFDKTKNYFSDEFKPKNAKPIIVYL